MNAGELLNENFKLLSNLINENNFNIYEYYRIDLNNNEIYKLEEQEVPDLDYTYYIELNKNLFNEKLQEFDKILFVICTNEEETEITDVFILAIKERR